MKQKKCPKCNYQWIPRRENPKECPKCKKRLDKTNGADRK